MLWVGCLLHIANVQLEECLGAEGEELCDIMMVLDWCSTEHPCVLGLHTVPLRSVRVLVSSNTISCMVYMHV